MRSTVIGAVCVFLCATFSTAQGEEGGYANPLSVAPGETIRFYLSTGKTKFDVSIYRCDGQRTLVKTINAVDGGVQQVSDSAFFYGCNWKSSCALVVPSTWASGVYDAEFSTTKGTKKIVFVVREATPGKISKIIVSLAASTWEAYNNFGGRSLYNFNSADHRSTYRVSFNRPFTDSTEGNEDQSYFRWGSKLSTWLEREEITAAYVMNTDLDKIPNLLDAYRILVIVGHDEYWTKSERNAVEQFLASGNRIIILGGNTCWWQSRLADNAQSLICYKNYAADPYFPQQRELATDLWYKYPLNNPENKFTGGSWRFGGLINTDTFLPYALGYGGYAAWNTHHWIHRGTGMDDGDVYGYRDAIVGYEVDGALFTWPNGLPTVTGDDSTPSAFRILSSSPATVGNDPSNSRHATLGMMHTPGGGAVFNVSTTNWVDGLEHDPIVQRITRNVFTRFASGIFPPDITAWTPFRVVADTINHEKSYFSSRTIAVPNNRPVKFAAAVYDPAGTPLTYSWTVNGVKAGHDSMFTWTPNHSSSSQKSIVVLSVRNSKDSTTIAWTIYTTFIKIVSQPKAETHHRGMDYRYKVDAASSTNDSLHYSIVHGPPWSYMTYDGVVRGTVGDSTGDIPVTVRAEDAHGNSDTQNYTIHIGAPNRLHHHAAAPATASLASFPNPFAQSTTIEFALNRMSNVSLHIFTSDGRLIRTIVSHVVTQAGTHSATWDGLDDHGSHLQSGIYNAVLSLQSIDAAQPSIMQHSLILLR